MANRYRNLIRSTAEYTQVYNSFRGVELNASSYTSSPTRLAYAENMYKDYDGDGADAIESIPGFRCFANYGEAVHALYYQRSLSGDEDYILVHVGSRLMRVPLSDIYTTDAVGEEIAELEDGESFGFEYGTHFYVMDSERILQISDSGEACVIGEDGSSPYVPTTYVSGEIYEQRNMLTDAFKEEYYVEDPTAYLFSSGNLKLTVTDPFSRYCAVKGVEDGFEGDLYVPAYANIAGVRYKVTTIASDAFAGNTSVTAVYVAEGISGIGDRAFSGCTAIEKIVTPPTLSHIGDSAFSGCAALTELYLGAGLISVGSSAVSGCPALTNINYALGEDELEKIDGASSIKIKDIIFDSVSEEIKISLPLHDRTVSISSVKVDGETVEYECTEDGEGRVEAVTLVFSGIPNATGIKVEIEGVLEEEGDDWSADMTTVSSQTPYQAIIKCRIAEVFDGRIFFSGNPDFPNTVFYTERVKQSHEGAIYVGRYNYFNDGVGAYKVKAILAVRDMLAVFKEGDDGSGSIFYHQKEGTDIDAIDTIYPVAYVHSGICSAGGAKSFLDDPVFLSTEGLMALNAESINYQRNVVCRSHNVNYAMLKENLSDASLCEWLGYLVVGVNGKMFLADSRATFTHPTGAREYEWFYASGIGCYVGDETVYRYSYDSYADAEAHPYLGGQTANYNGIYSATDDEGELYYYTKEDDTKYYVVATDERMNGDFTPATHFMSHGKHLFFSTDEGHVCVFNNDMRGVAPSIVADSPDYYEEDYMMNMGGRIHPIFYSFAGHSAQYAVKTALDDCGIPHLTKNTVGKSLVIKARSYNAFSMDCEVLTDCTDPEYIDSLPYHSNGFESFDFTAMPWAVSKYASTAMPEKKKGWIEKQVNLVASSYASPISVYSISYRYTLRGKIKNTVI